MIRLTCANCNKKLAVDASKAGKTGVCPGCKSPLRIPDVPEAEAAETAVKMRPSVLPPRPSLPDMGRNAVAPAPPQRRSPEPVSKVETVEEAEPADRDDEPEQPRTRRKKKRKRRKSTSVATVYIFLGAAVGIYLLLLVLAVFSRAGSILLLVMGFPLLAVGHFWFMYLARLEDSTVYLMVRYVPFYSVYYFFTRIHETYKPFLTGSVGALFVLTGSIAMLVRGGSGDYIDPGRSDDRPEVQNLRPEERERLAQDLLRRGDKAEARAWLGGRRGRSALGLEPAEVAQHVRQLYAKGAREVLVADVDVSDPNEEHAEYLIVVLPEDRRTAVFEYARTVLNADDPDTGQKYLVLH